MRAQEPDSLFRDPCQLQQAHHLESKLFPRQCRVRNFEPQNNRPTAVGQDVMPPSLKLVRPSNGVQGSLPRLQAQVICIIET